MSAKVVTLAPAVPRTDLKRCVGCKEYKTRDQFRGNRARNDGLQTRCRPCQNKRTRHTPGYKKYQKTLPVLIIRYFGLRAKEIRNRANKKGLPCTVTGVSLRDLWIRQEGKCALTGIDMRYTNTPGGKNITQPHSLSVDRVIPELGYVKDNIRLVCWSVNTFRGTMGDEAMYEMAKRLLAHRKKL